MWLYQKLIEFLNLGGFLYLWETQGLKAFATLQGVQALIVPLFPILLLVEVIFLAWANRRAPGGFKTAYKIPFLMYAVNLGIAALLIVDTFFITHNFFSKFAIVSGGASIWWFLYALLAYEFSHFVFHYSCHKVRLLWCLHSPHHAPNHMNLSVIYTAFFLHGAYATFIRTAICAVLGVPMAMLIMVKVIDGTYGSLIHVSEEAWKSGRFRGIFGRVILSPFHHRVHHASNPEYIDKNYCNITTFWDRVFGTFQDHIPGVKPRYGLAREIDYTSFSDTYFGEIRLLWRDMRASVNLKTALLYMINPPGWKPGVLAEPLSAGEPVPKS